MSTKPALTAKRKEQLRAFCGRMGVAVDDLALLDMALTHTSYAHEARELPKPQHNERIEFLGDSVLSLIVSTYMYKNFPELAEGQLTKLRAALVCEASLYGYAKKLRLGDYLRLGRGEDNSGGRARPSLLADAFEAVLGAVYLDQGFKAAESYILGLMGEDIDYVSRHGSYNDYKTILQEYLQQQKDVEIAYQLLGSSGPEHDKTFTSRVSVNGRAIGEGSGRSKKDAEQHAAKAALDALNVSRNL